MQKKATPPKTQNPKEKTTHKINQKCQSRRGPMIHAKSITKQPQTRRVSNEQPNNTPTIVVLEVEYYKIRHINPVLADFDI